MPKFDPAVTDKLTSMDADWPKDPAVPELPPIPDATNPPPPKDNYLWKYYNDHTRKPRAVPPGPLTDIVNEENPLEADVCWSMRYDTAIQYIGEHTKEVDAVWQKNQMIQLNAGHGGVPLMIFQGEPFFGQDRFDEFYWCLRQSGLTRRDQPRGPFTVKPLRWPDNE